MALVFGDELRIEMVREEDWEEIMPGYIEGTYMSLGPGEREDMGPGTIRERASMQSNPNRCRKSIRCGPRRTW